MYQYDVLDKEWAYKVMWTLQQYIFSKCDPHLNVLYKETEAGNIEGMHPAQDEGKRLSFTNKDSIKPGKFIKLFNIYLALKSVSSPLSWLVGQFPTSALIWNANLLLLYRCNEISKYYRIIFRDSFTSGILKTFSQANNEIQQYQCNTTIFFFTFK